MASVLRTAAQRGLDRVPGVIAVPFRAGPQTPGHEPGDAPCERLGMVTSQAPG